MDESLMQQVRLTLTNYLEENKLRKTPERYAILDAIFDFNAHFTLEELEGKMESNNFRVSRATLFNTMELFCDAGLTIRHSLATAAHYEMRTDNNPKAYTICHQCNTITKVSTSTAKLALQNLHVRYFGIEEKIVYIHGICRKCQAKNRQEAKKRKTISNPTLNGKKP